MAIPRPELGKVPAKKRLNDKMLDELVSRRTTPTDDNKVVKPKGTGVGEALPAEDKGKPARNDSEGDLDYLSRLRSEQGKVRDATESDLAATKAKAQLDAGSRAGLAGMGLSGASAALQSDIGRQQDRSSVLTLADLDKSQNDEEFDAIGRQGAIMDYEDAYDVDMDGDGIISGVAIDLEAGIGDGDPDNNPEEEARGTDATPEGRKKALADKNAAELNSWDMYKGDRDVNPGDQEEPYVFDGNIQELYAYLQESGAWPVEEVQVGGIAGFRSVTLLKDKYGNYYYLDRG